MIFWLQFRYSLYTSTSTKRE